MKSSCQPVASEATSPLSNTPKTPRRSLKLLKLSGGLFLLLSSFVLGMATVYWKLPPFDFLQQLKVAMIGERNERSLYYRNKKTLHETFTSDSQDVVFIGDSLTDGAEWHELFPGLKIANRGIGGDTTDGILERIDSITSTNARYAFIMVGVNDFSKGRSPNLVFENYKKIVEELLRSDIEVYIQSTVLCGERCKRYNNSIRTLNEYLYEYSLSNKDIAFIDLNKWLSKNGQLKKELTFDDMHLNGSGYKLWESALASHSPFNQLQ